VDHPLVVKLKPNTPHAAPARLRIKLDDWGFEKSRSADEGGEMERENGTLDDSWPLENLIFTMQMVNLINVQSLEPRHIIP
jgi:hypothetical protein